MSTLQKVLHSFSFSTNSKKLLKVGKPNELTLLNGVRVVSSFYVILGHFYMLSLFTPTTNVVTMI